MDVMDAMLTRRSTKADTLGEPAPRGETLVDLLQAGMSAPDHGAIRPWRFKVIDGKARERLGDVFADALRRREPKADAEALEAIRSKPLRAPLIVAVCAEIMGNHPKVPAVEQIVSAACVAQNVLTAAHARGYGAILLSGWPAYDPHVKQALGLADKDAIVGFLYLGTPREAPRDKKRPAAADFLSIWDGELATAE